MSKMKVMCLCGLQPCEAHPSTMSTVDIDKGAENIAKLNKLGYPELDGACPTCGINPVTILAHHTQTLKAELLAKSITVEVPDDELQDMVKIEVIPVKIVNEL